MGIGVVVGTSEKDFAANQSVSFYTIQFIISQLW